MEGEVKLSHNALIVLQKRYLKKDEEGRVIETPGEMFRRVAHNIAQAELIYNPKADYTKTEEEFYTIMNALEFLPNSPTLMNAGRDLQQLSACFVLPVEDSLQSIFETVKHTAIIHQSGGGTGFSFSRLRPKNDRVATTGGEASGPVSFMKVYNMTTEVIKQGGTRRGANMGILRVDHPDIMEFIRIKNDPKEMTNFNLSVALTREFMEALERDDEHKLINPRNKKVVQRLKAREVFDEIINSAWLSGEPGVIFLNRINRDNPTPLLGEIEATNPCGEQPLLPYESCNLGSINISKMLIRKNGVFAIDYERLERVIKLAVRFLDDVIDMNLYPFPQIAEITEGNRKIGVGVMGFADMLIRLGVPYNSKEALKIGKEVMQFVQNKANEVSVELAQVRGTFKNFKGSIYDRPGGPKVRNATRTTIAPTGTLSIIANCSSGIEPIFGITYIRNILDDTELVEVNPLFEEIAKERGFYSETLMREIVANGSIQHIKEIPADVRRIFIVAHEIPPEGHVLMQAAFQKYTDNAVSKTINFPYSATKEDVKQAYLLAYKEGCKGITIYRSGTREKQVLSCKNTIYC